MESLESREAAETFEKLQNYLSQGFLLHGSKRAHEVLEPRQANDDANQAVGSLNAVYATGDMRIAVLKALFDVKDTSKDGGRFFYHHISGDTDRFRAGGENAHFTPGYVHVLPPEQFERIEDGDARETVAREPVTPVDVIRVTPDILHFLSGITYEMN